MSKKRRKNWSQLTI